MGSKQSDGGPMRGYGSDMGDLERREMGLFSEEESADSRAALPFLVNRALL